MFDSRIGIHGHGKNPAGPGNAACTLKQRPSEGVCLGEFPKSRSFLGGPPVFFMHHHMEFPKQIMRKDCGHHVQMVAVQPPDGDIIKIALRFQLAEGIFLRSSAVVKAEDLLHRRLFVRDDHLELEAVLVRNEQVELDRFLRLLLDLPADKKKAKAGVPLFGLPLRIEIRQFAIEVPPASPALNHALKLGKPLKGHRYRKLDSLGIECRDDLVAEESAVHTHLNDNAGTGGSDYTYALHHELKGSVGVMDIAGTREHIEDLSRLGYRAEQVIVASLPFLLLIKAYRRAFGHSPVLKTEPSKSRVTRTSPRA